MAETKFRVESDLLGELQVPADAYYGVQTQRALNNYKISNTRMCDYPEYIIAMAYVKMAAAEANARLGVLDRKIADAIVDLCGEPVSFERLLQKLFDRYQLTMTFEQHALVGSTVRSYLTWLTEQGKLQSVIEGNRMLWRRQPVN